MPLSKLASTVNSTLHRCPDYPANTTYYRSSHVLHYCICLSMHVSVKPQQIESLIKLDLGASDRRRKWERKQEQLFWAKGNKAVVYIPVVFIWWCEISWKIWNIYHRPFSSTLCDRRQESNLILSERNSAYFHVEAFSVSLLLTYSHHEKVI